jgi:hypothetical protein
MIRVDSVDFTVVPAALKRERSLCDEGFWGAVEGCVEDTILPQK